MHLFFAGIGKCFSKRKVGSEAGGGRGLSEGGHRGYSIEWPIRGGSARGTFFRLQVYEKVGVSLVELKYMKG